MNILIYLFITAAVALILWPISASPRVSAKRLLQEENQVDKKIKARSALSSIFPFTPRLLEKSKLDIKIKNRLDAAHLKLNPAEFLNLKLILILVLSSVSIFVFGKFDIKIFLASLALGYILPDFWLNRKIAQRKYKIARRLPETVDLLGLCVEGGLDFTSSVTWIIKKTASSPFVEELGFILEEISWGKPRAQALKDMAKRLNIPEVSSFVQTLVQAERMGTPVVEAFAILSEDMRLHRFHRGERYATQAPIKILIPLIFCILPVIGIIIGGPIFLQFMQGGLFKGFGG